MIQPFHFWVYTQKNQKQGLKQKLIYQYTQKHYSEYSEGRNNSNAHDWTMGK